MTGRTTGERLELAATILLAVAAVATAWSSYQATRWNGEQAKDASATNAIRVEAARAQGQGLAETQVDVATFIQWVDADAHDDEVLTDFYADRFRDEFQPAFDAWLATDALVNPDAPPTPFAMPEYQVAATEQAADLDQEAEASAAEVREDIQRASNYVLGVVLFAVALFFAGISTKLDSERLRAVMLGIGYVIFLGALVWVATFPVSFAT
ncbi:MAG TPA: hypothetical protein VIT01_00820 [Acidimicrobiales bacterium]